MNCDQGRKRKVKHVKGISRGKPAPADLTQDILCSANDILIAIKQISAPAKGIVADACAIPDQGTTT